MIQHTNIRSELKELLFLISKKWSKLSKREAKPFCPYLYINCIGSDELIELKKELATEDFCFIDGYDFQYAPFNVKSLLVKPDYNNGISLKFINDLSHLDKVLTESKNTKEIYQFYLDKPFYHNESPNLKHIKIQIKTLNNILEII